MKTSELAPIVGPPAWRGDSIGPEDTWIYQLSAEEVAELELVGRRFLRDDPDLRTVTASDYPLPLCAEGIAATATEIDSGRGFVLTRGLRVDEYSDALAASIFFVMGLHLGDPMRQNELGDLLDHVRATSNKTRAEDPNALGSRIRDKLSFHSDSSDVVALLCLRPSKEGGASSLISGAALYNEILSAAPELAELLFEPWYFDWYRQDHDAPEKYYASPMCAYVDGVFSMYAGSSMIHSAQDYPEVPRLTADRLRLLELIDEVMAQPGMRLDMDFQVGDIQWLLNYAAMHSRTAFVDHPEPERRRHLLRLWLKRDSGRPIPEGFGRHVVVPRHEVRDTATGDSAGHFSIRAAAIPRADWGN